MSHFYCSCKNNGLFVKNRKKKSKFCLNEKLLLFGCRVNIDVTIFMLRMHLIIIIPTMSKILIMF